MRFNMLFCDSNHPLPEGAIWGTTLHAKWRVSMSDCSSFRVQDFLHSHLQRASLMCLILSHGRPASSLIESMSMPGSSVTWVGPIVSSWAIGDPQIVNHDEERAEICAALRFRWFSYDDVMQDMVHKAGHFVTQTGGSYRNSIFPSIASIIAPSHPDVPGIDRRQLLYLFWP